MLYYGKYDEDDKVDWIVPGCGDIFWDSELGYYVAVAYDEDGSVMILDGFDHRPY